MRIAEFGQKHMYETSGGIETVVTELVRLLAENGDSVTAINRWELDRPDRVYPEETGIRLLNAPTMSNTKINAMAASFFSTLICLCGQYDVIHIHAEGPAVFLPLLKLAGKKTVVTVHGLDWKRGKWGKFASWYIRLGERMAAKYADGVIVLSEDMQSYFRDVYGRETERVENGCRISLTNKTGLIEDLGLSRDGYYLFLGRIVPEKRLDLLLQAYRKLDTKRELVVAGWVPETFKKTEYYQEAQKDPRIRFVGFVDGERKAELYANTHCFVLPSDLEGQSIALLEAIGYGVNVVCSDIHENMAVSGGYCMTFHAGDADSLLRKLQEADRLPFLRSRERYDYISREHGVQQMYRETDRVLRKVAGE